MFYNFNFNVYKASNFFVCIACIISGCFSRNSFLFSSGNTWIVRIWNIVVFTNLYIDQILPETFTLKNFMASLQVGLAFIIYPVVDLTKQGCIYFIS